MFIWVNKARSICRRGVREERRGEERRGEERRGGVFEY
jgi:hypothetical protein